jgi:DNA-damage-inducible protein D
MSNKDQNGGEIKRTGTASSPFDQIRRVRADGSEYWSARELMPCLGYVDWRNMETAIDRAQASCVAQGLYPADHFVGANEMVGIGSGARRDVSDVHLTRYGCYLVAMNGDPRKPEIAAAQQHFALMTRVAEVNGLAQQAAAAQDPILVMLKACQAQREAQLALENKVASPS